MKPLVCSELVVRRVDGVPDVHTACGRPAVYIRTYWRIGRFGAGRPHHVREVICAYHGPGMEWLERYGNQQGGLRDDGLPITTFRRLDVA